MHILITGSEGYIGTVLTNMLISQGYTVTGVDSCFYEEGNLDKTSFLKYNLIRKDIRSLDISDLKDKGYDAIIHLAALSNDPLGTLNEQLTYDINYHASVKLAKLAKKAKIKRFIFSSSCSLYGAGEEEQLTEESQANPQTAYGKSKILAEKDIGALADEDFSPTFMRNATAFGFSSRMRFDIVVNNLSGYAIVENEIKILGDGKPWRPLVHVRDICQAFILVLNSSQNKIHNQAFNIGSTQENYQIKTIAKHIQNFTNCNISIKHDNLGDSRDYNVSFSKIQDLLGFNVEYPLDLGIQELLQKYTDIHLGEEFYHRYYTRLQQINYLLQNNKIDSELFWTKN